MSIRFAILALLDERASYGYEIKAEFDRRTNRTWPLNIGQVYTTLDRLERDQLVSRGSENAEGRVMYEITPGGSRAVSDWFASVIPDNPQRDELAIKIAMAATRPGCDVGAIIQNQRRESMRALQNHHQALRGIDEEDLAGELVIQSLIYSSEAQIRWLDHCETAALRASRSASRGAGGPGGAGTPRATGADAAAPAGKRATRTTRVAR